MAKNETKKNIEIKLNPKVWEVPFNSDLIAQVLYVYFSNERKGTSNAKTRGDVHGGGRKPWKQKGTGRARQGSIRSPLWVGGGVTFVPSNRNWKKSINKKMVKKAACMMLSKRLGQNAVDFVKMDSEKELKDIRKNVPNSEEKMVLVSQNEKINLAARNMSLISVITPMKLNVKNIVNAKKLLIDEECIKILEERLINGK